MNLQPAFHSPIAAPAVDTSPEALGLDELSSGSSQQPDNSSPSRHVNRLSKTVDKLGRSLSGKTSTATGTGTGHRRIFSLSRKGKGKGKEKPSGEGN